METLSELLAVDDPKAITCTGRFYRCVVNNYVDNKGDFTTKITMVLVKRLSCRGCGKCGWQEDDIHENTVCDHPPIIREIEHDGLYELRMTNVGTDWETGYVDSWDLEYFKVGKYERRKAAGTAPQKA